MLGFCNGLRILSHGSSHGKWHTTLSFFTCRRRLYSTPQVDKIPGNEVKVEVLAGWDWICQNLTHPIQSGALSTDESKLPSKIGVCGELVGGSIAAMLALTECPEAGNHSIGVHKSRINAAAIGNPVVDWTALFPEGEDTLLVDRLESSESVFKPNDTTRCDDDFLSIQSLMNFRKFHFHKPEYFFDPFASPSLFFRTPSFDLPYAHHPLAPDDTSNDDASPKHEASAVVRKKRFYRRLYPPVNTKLVLPPMKVTFGKDSVLRDQALDFVERLRGSARQGEGLSPTNPTDNAVSRFSAEQKEGLGLWGQKDMVDVGAWFGDVLRRP
ncbi:MAG: hypothetical protein Q9217_000458 [Psora testacea]